MIVVCFLSGGLKQFLFLVSRGVVVFLDNVRFRRRKWLYVLAGVVGVFLVFLSAYFLDFNCVEYRWVDMKSALVDLAPNCETVQEAVYIYFEKHNS